MFGITSLAVSALLVVVLSAAALGAALLPWFVWSLMRSVRDIRRSLERLADTFDESVNHIPRTGTRG